MSLVQVGLARVIADDVAHELWRVDRARVVALVTAINREDVGLGAGARFIVIVSRLDCVWSAACPDGVQVEFARAIDDVVTHILQHVAHLGHEGEYRAIHVCLQARLSVLACFQMLPIM